jgi:hypothetical protein
LIETHPLSFFSQVNGMELPFLCKALVKKIYEGRWWIQKICLLLYLSWLNEMEGNHNLFYHLLGHLGSFVDDTEHNFQDYF